MPIKQTGSASVHEIDRWDGGVGWIAHPDETMQRASHAIAVADEDGTDEVWVIDPVDAAGVDELIGDLGDVAGVVCSLDRHTRDAAAVAARHDVSVFVPEWMSGVEGKVDAPIETFGHRLADSGFRAIPVRNSSVPPWQEVALFDGETLYVGDAVGTAPYFLTPGERLGVHPMLRLIPPRDAFRGLDPDRIVVGHGTGIHENATRVLREALANARRGVPTVYLRALIEMGRGAIRR